MTSETQPTQTKPWLVIGLGFILVLALAYSAAFFAADAFRRKPIQSVDDLEIAQIETLGLEVINRPDGGIEIKVGGKDPMPIPPEHFEAVLAPLRHANRTDRPRGIYLGQIPIRLKDGRKVTILLHHDNKNTLLYRIGDAQFETSSLSDFLQPVTEVESKIKSSR